MTRLQTVPKFESVDYDYGNRPEIEVIRLLPVLGKVAIDPHESLEQPNIDTPPFSIAQLREGLAEVAREYKIISDPSSDESELPQLGITVANKHLLEQGIPAILVIATSGSSLYDEHMNPNNESNAIEVVLEAFQNPDKPVVYVEPPGNGNSTNLTGEEYRQATKDGKLIYEERDHAGRITCYAPFETIAAMARALEAEGIKIGYISSKASGAHFSSALESALPKNSLERALLYSPTNISDRFSLVAGAATLWEIAQQSKYKKRSHDPLRLSEEWKEMAREIMASQWQGSLKKRKIDQARAATHSPKKLGSQQKIFSKGNKRGQAAAVQIAVGQIRHANLKQTVVLPEMAAFYKRPEDFIAFMEWIKILGGTAVEPTNVESLKVPMGQYGHSYYPTAYFTLEKRAFNR